MILMLPFAMQFTGLFNWFAFLYVKPNCKEICKEIFPPSFIKKKLMSSFLLRFKANYLKEMRSYHCHRKRINLTAKRKKIGSRQNFFDAERTF